VLATHQTEQKLLQYSSESQYRHLQCLPDAYIPDDRQEMEWFHKRSKKKSRNLGFQSDKSGQIVWNTEEAWDSSAR